MIIKNYYHSVCGHMGAGGCCQLFKEKSHPPGQKCNNYPSSWIPDYHTASSYFCSVVIRKHIGIAQSTIKMFLLFLVGWGTDQLSGFGEERGTKHQIINLIHSIRTVMRSKF